MPSLTLESKSNGSLSLETKDSGITWDQATGTWDDMNSPWDSPKITLTRESKSSGNLSLEAK